MTSKLLDYVFVTDAAQLVLELENFVRKKVDYYFVYCYLARLILLGHVTLLKQLNGVTYYFVYNQHECQSSLYHYCIFTN